MTDSFITSKYPIIIRSEKNEIIARLSNDRKWSVRWSKVIDQAYADVKSDNVALKAICQVIVAARDNFITETWEHLSDEDEGANMTIGVFDQGSINNSGIPAFALVGREGPPFAWVNHAGQWSVDWHGVLDTRDPDPGVQMGGFCDLMLAARDRFLAVSVKRKDD